MRLFVALAIGLLATPSLAQGLTGNIAIHDPTIAVLEVFHFYNQMQGGTPNLYLTKLQWDEDGWPVVTALE